jgi:cytochrome c oxidase subunit IV
MMELEMEHADEYGHIVPYRTFIGIWLLLLLLTALLVFVSTVFHDLLSVPALLTITPLKAGLVFFYFMHLKYEKPFLKTLIFMVLVVLTMFIGLTFLDLSYR